MLPCDHASRREEKRRYKCPISPRCNAAKLSGEEEEKTPCTNIAFLP